MTDFSGKFQYVAAGGSYLSDDELERDPKFHRYAIAARRIPEVREVRASFLGCAAHSSLTVWQGQIKTILAKAGF
jgi:hypothetical protein